MSTLEIVLFHCLDEFVGDMVVDPDAACAKSKHTERVLVIVGQRPVVYCIEER